LAWQLSAVRALTLSQGERRPKRHSVIALVGVASKLEICADLVYGRFGSSGELPRVVPAVAGLPFDSRAVFKSNPGPHVGEALEAADAARHGTRRSQRVG
jgi:hypothetical protein